MAFARRPAGFVSGRQRNHAMTQRANLMVSLSSLLSTHLIVELGGRKSASYAERHSMLSYHQRKAHCE